MARSVVQQKEANDTRHSIEHEMDFVRDLGTGKHEAMNILMNRAGLLMSYRGALRFRTWDGMQSIERSLPRLEAFVDAEIAAEGKKNAHAVRW